MEGEGVRHNWAEKGAVMQYLWSASASPAEKTEDQETPESCPELGQENQVFICLCQWSLNVSC